MSQADIDALTARIEELTTRLKGEAPVDLSALETAVSSLESVVSPSSTEPAPSGG